MVDRDLGQRILESLEKLEGKIDRTQEVVTIVSTKLALVEQRLTQFLTESEIIKMIMDHSIQCPGSKKSSTSIVKPATDGGGVSWGNLLKWTSILISVLGAGIAIGKLVV